MAYCPADIVLQTLGLLRRLLWRSDLSRVESRWEICRGRFELEVEKRVTDHTQTGGQDDLITIISPREGRVVARGQGHASYVTSIAFDRRRSNARTYRFGTVGEDGRLLFVSTSDCDEISANPYA
jgi:hypothetical protein